MIKPYWHKIPAEDQKAVKLFSGMTVKQFMERYRQPKWCGYDDALEGQMGCWSLFLLEGVVTEEFCKQGCDLYMEEDMIEYIISLWCLGWAFGLILVLDELRRYPIPEEERFSFTVFAIGMMFFLWPVAILYEVIERMKR